ncbi:MAG: hypothetical protein K0U37_05865 [Gammaproteobacteria bacterium]|nr:hypothetical protein [Gammaproteobacteria bacterium]
MASDDFQNNDKLNAQSQPTNTAESTDAHKTQPNVIDANISTDLQKARSNLAALRVELASIEDDLKVLPVAEADVKLKQTLLDNATRYLEDFKLIARMTNAKKYAEAVRLKELAQSALDEAESELHSLKDSLENAVEQEETLNTRIAVQEKLCETLEQGISEGKMAYAAAEVVDDAISHGAIILSEYEKKKGQRERFLAKKHDEREEVQTLLQAILANSKLLAEQQVNQRDLERAKNFAENAVNFDGEDITVNHIQLGLLSILKAEVEESKENVKRLKLRHWIVRFLDKVFGFIFNKPSTKQQAKALFKEKKEAFDELMQEISEELEATKRAVENAKTASTRLGDKLNRYDKLETIEAAINALTDTLAFDLEATIKAFVERCQPESHLGTLVETQASNQVKQALLKFLKFPAEHTLDHLKNILNSKIGQAALTNVDLIKLLHDVGDIYAEVSHLLPEEELLTIDTAHMAGLLSKDMTKKTERIEKLKAEKRELTAFIEAHQEKAHAYESRIDNNTSALETAYRILFSLQKLALASNMPEEEVSVIQVCILKTQKKIEAIKQDLPRDVVEPLEHFFKALDVKKHDFNAIFLVRHYQADVEAFYNILGEYTNNKTILKQPLTFRKLQLFREELGAGTWTEACEKLTALPAIRERFYQDNEEQISRTISAMVPNETIFFNAVMERVDMTLEQFKQEINRKAGAEKEAALAIYSPLVDAYNIAPFETMTDVKKAAAAFKAGMDTPLAHQVFGGYAWFPRLHQAISILNDERNQLLEEDLPHEEVTPEEMATTGQLIQQVHEVERRLENITEQLPKLEIERNELLRRQGETNKGTVNFSFQSTTIKELIDDCKQMTVRHGEVRVALKNFLSYPTARLFSKLKTAMEKNPRSLTDSTIGPLIERASRIYPQISTAHQFITKKGTAAEYREQVGNIKPTDSDSLSPRPKPPGDISSNPTG